jgi:gas vesicle protein
MADQQDIGGFFVGFVVGGLIGAAAALLFAPQSGEQTRAEIRERTLELKEQADQLGSTARSRAVELQTVAKERAAEVTAQTKEKAAGLQAKVKQAVDEGKGAATERKEDFFVELGDQAAAAVDQATEPA